MILGLALFRQSLKDPGFKFFLMIFITSDSDLPVFSFISSNVILSAKAAHIIQFSSFFFGAHLASWAGNDKASIGLEFLDQNNLILFATEMYSSELINWNLIQKNYNCYLYLN